MSYLRKLDSPDLNERLREAIHLLPVDIKQITEWYYFDNLTVMDISKKIGRSKLTVTSKLKRAIYYLRKELNPSYYDQAVEIIYGKTPDKISF